ncbi:DUF6491 family protein [Sphingobium sufflavum]|uniref:DUF6491 family protein n=1 Tax=Sphingobium sufflavum TaxID=1129547 RepID=UPI001F3230E8|nr:DUF6491 family protein [Sphingobium sufflavum]MCE7797601.1 DUF6491 family protein [Sphingobium sufflavum]
MGRIGGRIGIYASAFAAAFMVFAVTGGIRASEQAVRAEEQGATRLAIQPGRDATIPFPNSGAIRDWQPDGASALFVQDQRGHWYRATLIAPCTDLPTASRIAFLTQGADQLDKYSSVAVQGQRCAFSTLVTSDRPSKRSAKHALQQVGGQGKAG